MPRGTKADADLDLLTAVERGEVVTQQTLKHELGVSVGLINALLKRAVKKGLVKVREAPYRRFAYYLTPQGFVEKGRLVADYIEFSLELFRDARDQYAEIFRDIRERRLDSVVLIGGGELTEIAVLASFGEEAVVTAIVDPGANVTRRYGITVLSSLDSLGPIDAAIITDPLSPQQTYEAVRRSHPTLQVYAPRILRITVDRAELPAQSVPSDEDTT